MDKYKKINSDLSFLKKDNRILAIIIFGSQTSDENSIQSDKDLCIVAPNIKNKENMKEILESIYRNVDISGKKYDIWLFEELSIYMKIQVIEHHKIIYCKDIPALYEYFYFYRKLWKDQKHRQDLTKKELIEIINK